MQVLVRKQASVIKQASVNNQHLDLDDQLFSRIASHVEMETSTMQALDLEQWLTKQASVTNQRIDLEDQLFSRTSTHAKMETSTMLLLREMTSKSHRTSSRAT
jgi:predicted ATPase